MIIFKNKNNGFILSYIGQFSSEDWSYDKDFAEIRVYHCDLTIYFGPHSNSPYEYGLAETNMFRREIDLDKLSKSHKILKVKGLEDV